MNIILIALQWHPELAIDDHAQQRIFHALVEAARAQEDTR